MKLFRRISMVPWKVLWIGMPAVFMIAWLMMRYGEPDKPIAELANFWWYFIVTAATVGYGDLYPVSSIGRLAGLLIIVFGITLFGITIAKVTEIIIQNRDRRLRGKMDFSKTTRHTLIIGYTKGDIELLVSELKADSTERHEKIILVSGTLEQNPLPGVIDFVAGDPTDDAVLHRAGIAGADRIIVFPADEFKTLSYALVANALAAPTAHIVVMCQVESCVTQLRRINPRISAVLPQTVRIAVQELQERGSAKLVEDLLSTMPGTVTMFSHHFPNGHSDNWGEFSASCKDRFDALLLGIHVPGASNPEANPAIDTKIGPGATVFYIAKAKAEMG